MACITRQNILLGLAALSLVACGDAIDAGVSQQAETRSFAFSFEDGNAWKSTFEEIVNNNSNCYKQAVGNSKRVNGQAFNGAFALRVWANEQRSNFSNHVIAQEMVSDRGVNGAWEYTTHALIDPETAATGQAGPEVSVQNTRFLDSKHITTTAGIQYVSNPHDPNYGSWNIWRETSPGIGNWVRLAQHTIEAGTWYTIRLSADFDTNEYIELVIENEGGVERFDLDGIVIAKEQKWNEEGLHLTLESENLWNNCGAGEATDYRVYYDDVTLARR